MAKPNDLLHHLRKADGVMLRKFVAFQLTIFFTDPDELDGVCSLAFRLSPRH